MNKPTYARDAFASLVVFLVALPLCIGVAIASGVPPAMGLVSGIVGGIVVGLLAGSPLQVCGPAAGLAVIVYEIVSTHGLAALAPIVLAAGLLQVVAGRLKLGSWFRAVAPPVVHAMLAGIGVVILGSQLHVMLGAAPQAGGLENFVALPATVANALSGEGQIALMSAGIGSLCLALMYGWNLLRAHPPRFFKALSLHLLPAPLIGVGGATAATVLLALDIARVKVPRGVSELIAIPSTEQLALLLDPAVLLSAVALFVIASAEGLLSASAVDRLHDGEASDLDKELFAQGVGNVIAGALGGLPVTGVIVRSTANIQAGATSRVSAVLHGVWLVGFVLLLPATIEQIPVAALAAVLVAIGWKLIDVDVMKSLRGQSRSDLAIYAITLVAIVATSLLDGLVIGVVASLMRLAWVASHLEIVVDTTGPQVEVDLRGAATFVRVPELTKVLRDLPAKAVVRVHIEHLNYIDHAVLEQLDVWSQDYERSGGEVLLEWHELRGRTAPRITARAA